eukprot:5187354-Amphidinium_carterae.2
MPGEHCTLLTAAGLAIGSGSTCADERASGSLMLTPSGCTCRSCGSGTRAGTPYQKIAIATGLSNLRFSVPVCNSAMSCDSISMLLSEYKSAAPRWVCGTSERNLRTLGALETVTRSKCQGTSCLTERAKALSGPGTHSMRDDRISSACRRSGSHLVVSVSGAVKFASTVCWVPMTGSKGQLGVHAMSPACATDPQACSTAWHAM